MTDFSPLIKDGAIRVTEANRKALKQWVIETYLNPKKQAYQSCLLYTSPSPRDRTRSRMPSSA